MVDKKTPHPDDGKELNSETISTMTSAEIFRKNREQHKGTFMDTSWRVQSQEKIEQMCEPGKSFKEKFWMGAYTYQGFVNRWSHKLNKQQEKVVFLEDILNRKEEYELERDQLLIKKTEMSVIRAFNHMRYPFMAIFFTWALTNAANTNRHFFVRFVPALVFIPFVSVYN
jgi:hypothetical protein